MARCLGDLAASQSGPRAGNPHDWCCCPTSGSSARHGFGELCRLPCRHQQAAPTQCDREFDIYQAFVVLVTRTRTLKQKKALGPFQGLIIVRKSAVVKRNKFVAFLRKNYRPELTHETPAILISGDLVSVLGADSRDCFLPARVQQFTPVVFHRRPEHRVA